MIQKLSADPQYAMIVPVFDGISAHSHDKMLLKKMNYEIFSQFLSTLV